jgi:hypothetical protein
MVNRLGLACLLVVLAAFCMGTRAQAQDDGAFVIKISTPCHFFDAAGAWTQAIGDCDFQIVVTPGLEVVNVTAHGVLPPSPTGAGALWSFGDIGLPCVIDGTPYSTTQWQETVTPNGQVAMHCSFR